MISLETELALERLLQLASPRLGPLTQLRNLPTWPGVNNNFLSEVEMCNPTIFGGQTIGKKTVGFGQGLHPPISMIKSLAEAIERYGAGFLPHNPADKKTATYQEISQDHHVWPFEDLQIFRPDQQNLGRYRRLEATDRIEWVRGQELGSETSREIWHPACFLTLNSKITHVYDTGTTSGFAVGSSLENATVSAICEVIERDCFASTWWTGRCEYPVFQPQDVWSLLPLHLRQSIQESDSPFYHIVDMTSKWDVPAFIIVFMGKDEDSRVVVASASHLDSRKALIHALGEASRIVNYHRRTQAQMLKNAPKPPYEKTMTSFYLHIAYGITEEAIRNHQFLIRGPREVPSHLFEEPKTAQSPQERMQSLIKKIEMKGSRTAVFDFSPIELQREDFFLIRAKIQHAVPIECAYAAKPLGCPALRDIPLAELNINPHCFP